MSARDEAIQAMHAADYSLDRDYTPTEKMLDAIPGDVLVRLAIERGALKQAVGDGWKDGSLAPSTPLYRLVTP